MIEPFPARRIPAPSTAESRALKRIEHRLDSLEAMLATLLDMLAQDAQDEPQALDLSGQPLPRDRGENAPL